MAESKGRQSENAPRGCRPKSVGRCVMLRSIGPPPPGGALRVCKATTHSGGGRHQIARAHAGSALDFAANENRKERSFRLDQTIRREDDPRSRFARVSLAFRSRFARVSLALHSRFTRDSLAPRSPRSPRRCPRLVTSHEDLLEMAPHLEALLDCRLPSTD